MSENKKQKGVPVGVLAVYLLLLFAAWTAYHLLVAPQTEKIPNELLSSLLNDGVLKNLIWTLPAVLLIRKYGGLLAVKPGELFTWNRECVKYLALFPIFAAYILLGLFVHKQSLQLSLTAEEIVTVIFVGITEELVFRGWLLNAMAGKLEPHGETPENEDEIPWAEYGVIALNAVIFLLIHFPRWISEGVFVTNMAQLGFVSIMMLSAVFSVVFLKTKNIVLPILLHMFWDLLIFLFK